MNCPLVSIIMPVYNGAAYLSQAIQWCLGQTCMNIELIIVDDCSADNSLEVALSYAAADQRVRVLRHAENRKLPAALNTGFDAARGEFLTWTSHDNFYADDAIAKMRAYLESHPDVGVVYSDFYCVDETGVVTGAIDLASPDQLMDRNVVGASFLYRRAVQKEIGCYDEELFLAEDYDFWLRVSRKFPLAHLAEKLYYYRNHEETLTNRRLEQVSFAVERTLEKFLRDNEDLDGATALKIRHHLMLRLYRRGSCQESLRYFWTSLKTTPLQALRRLRSDGQGLRFLLSLLFSLCGLRSEGGQSAMGMESGKNGR